MAEPPAEHSINFETSFYSSRVPFEAANVRIRGDVPIDVKDISAEKNLPKAVIMKKAVPKKSKEETKIKVSQKGISIFLSLIVLMIFFIFFIFLNYFRNVC